MARCRTAEIEMTVIVMGKFKGNLELGHIELE